MVTQGNNTAWNDAIKLAEINATPEGVARAEKVKADRNREYTKNRTRANRAKNKDANEARKAARKKFYFEKKTREKIKGRSPVEREHSNAGPFGPHHPLLLPLQLPPTITPYNYRDKHIGTFNFSHFLIFSFLRSQFILINI